MSIDYEICNPEVLKDESGEKFDIVDRGDHIMLLPVSNNPLESIREETKETNKSTDQMKREALETAMKEAGR